MKYPTANCDGAWCYIPAVDVVPIDITAVSNPLQPADASYVPTKSLILGSFLYIYP